MASRKATETLPRVLVVDDDPEALAFACKALGAISTVLAATCATDAIRMARESRPHVIVLDVIMQGGDNGFAILRELNADPLTRDIPVIFLTSVNEATGLAFGPEELHRYLGKEPAAFLEKPVSPDRLVAEVTRVMCPPESRNTPRRPVR